MYDKIKDAGIKTLTADAGYKTPAVAKLLIIDILVFSEKPFFGHQPFIRQKRNDPVIYQHYDCYICPNDQILIYSTTNRNGYREYKSNGAVCAGCPYLSQCTESKDHVKLVTRHIREQYMEMCEDIRQTPSMKELYSLRKETIERLFETAKENNGFRYTQMFGKARMEMKSGLTFACMNLKKLAKMKVKKGLTAHGSAIYKFKNTVFTLRIRKTLLA